MQISRCCFIRCSELVHLLRILEIVSHLFDGNAEIPGKFDREKIQIIPETELKSVWVDMCFDAEIWPSVPLGVSTPLRLKPLIEV